jgi:hypothetical protein
MNKENFELLRPAKHTVARYRMLMVDGQGPVNTPYCLKDGEALYVRAFCDFDVLNDDLSFPDQVFVKWCRTTLLARQHGDISEDGVVTYHMELKHKKYGFKNGDKIYVKYENYSTTVE